MKNYYELKKSDRQKYLKEFRKTPVGKEMNFRLICCWIITFAFWFVSGYVFGLTEDIDVFTKEATLFMNIMDILAIFGFVFSSLYSAYLNFNFTAWLKNKYEIRRW